MRSLTKLHTLFLVTAFAFAAPSFAQTTAPTPQEKEAAYVKMISDRSDKIVAKLGLTDSSQYRKVQDLVAHQYMDLNKVYEARDAKIKEAKAGITDKQALADQLKKIEESTTAQTDKLHQKYLKNLSKRLTPDQVVQIKDGMTYGVVGVTYKGYVDMIPSLTEVQKKQIMDWLVEAREHAMDAESSDKKHWWFGKYKGRINNYLSTAGYDITKERQAWQERLKEKQSAAKAN